MNVLVTGASGFVGRRMVAHLVKEGHTVTGIDLVPSLDYHVMQADAVTYFQDDIDDRNAGHAHNIVSFDLVVHCAYVVGGRDGIDNDATALAKNLQLDATMFRWAEETDQGHILYFSSSAVYPVELQTGKLRRDGEPFRLREDHACTDLPLMPDARYGWAKLTGEKLAEAARAQGMNVTVVRPFSGYGWDQSTDYPFTAFIDRVIQEKDPIEIWGDAHQKRDWIHIDDVVEGALAAVLHNIRTVNLCTGEAISMGEIVKAMCDITGHDPSVRILRDKPMGVMERVGDPTKMLDFYTPRHTLNESIPEAIALRRLHYFPKD